MLFRSAVVKNVVSNYASKTLRFAVVFFDKRICIAGLSVNRALIRSGFLRGNLPESDVAYTFVRVFAVFRPFINFKVLDPAEAEIVEVYP